MFYMGDNIRRALAEAAERAKETDGGVVNPFKDIITQKPPRTVPYWQPGTLYQPGSLVQANNYGDVAQTALTNAGFESGDTGWTKTAAFTIGAGTAYEGSNRALFTGQPAGKFVFAMDNTGSKIQATDDLATIEEDAFSGSERLIASSGPLAVSVAGGLSASSAHYTTDGSTWIAATTVPWSGAGTMERLFYESENALFYALFQSADTRYWTTPDGVTWTERAFPASLDCHYIFGRNGNTYAVMVNGTQYDLYVSASGTGSWSLVTSNIGVPVNGRFVDNGTTIVGIGYNGGTLEVWESNAAGTTWTQNTTGTTNLTAAVSVNSSFDLAYGDGTYVWNRRGSNGASTTDYVAYSTDLTTWTAANSFQSLDMKYSTVLSKFVSFTFTDTFVYSTDGITWSETATIAALGIKEGGEMSGEADVTATVVRHTCTNNDRATTFSGQVVSATAKVVTGADGYAQLGISFYNGGGTLLKTVYGDVLVGASTNWREIDVAAVAPLDAATCSVVCSAYGSDDVLYDDVQWDHYTRDEFSGLIFEATQAAAGYSDESEPTWPTVAGNTVVDHEVTWTARAANYVVWEAKPILLSGASEPTWPTEEGATVEDNTIVWTADSGRVKDENCPNTKQVAIVSSKVFCADDDIVAYSATVNPLDWSSPDDAGFIPFGLNTYGSEPVSALGIYRSNLVVWNSKAFQMWQVDEDPQNFALLDAIPVGNRFYKSASPVSNDLVWLTDEGVRNMGIAGATNNLQAGFFGKQIDPLVQAQIAAIADEDDILSLYYPGQGQYWIIFGDEAFVLTMNGGKSDMSWSRYTFPHAIDDYTVKDGELYLRSGDKVWLFDDSVTTDDTGGDNDAIEGRVWWHYLDFGALGITKSLIGFDVVASGTFNVAIGYDQSNTATATTDYSLTGDTLPNGVIPLPVTAPSFQFRLTWPSGAWEWYGSALYLQNWRTTS